VPGRQGKYDAIFGGEVMTAQHQLIMRSGPTPGATFILEGDQITVGRDSTNGITINDAEISRRHARLTYQGGKYILEDLGSTNGTFVNGQRLAGPRVLKTGEVISFGEQIVLVFEATNFDPGATMVSPRATAAPSTSRPIAIPPPPPMEYAGSVPASPVSTSEEHLIVEKAHAWPPDDCDRCRRVVIPVHVRHVLLVGRRHLPLVCILSIPDRLPVR
jgi:pSer/pThr/pTyr-binding forkhead associated (FHA) protein